MLRGAVILNGISRKKDYFYRELYPALTEHLQITVFETRHKGHALILAAEAAQNKFDVILAAGGDGTAHQVLNGLLSSKDETQLPSLGLIPLGTGNDFARTCQLQDGVQQLIELIKKNKPVPTDIGHLSCCDENGNQQQRFYLNCCSLGMGPEVVQRLESGSRKFGPTHTYMKAIVTTFLKQNPPTVKCISGEWIFEGKTRVVGVANGKSFGNAVYLAPDAELDDALLNVFVALDVPTIKFLWYMHLLKSKKKMSNKSVVYKTVRSITITSGQSCALETDGELAGYLPAEINVLPGRINFYR
jgi:diacylglycerol kinase (ATP)